MTPKIKYGLIVGIAGLVLTIVVALLSGCCGPLVAIAAGALAGYLANREEGGGAKTGAISGGISGVLILAGQFIGGIGSLLFFQSVGFTQQLGILPGSTDQASYWISGAVTGLCFGLLDAALAAGGGAAAAAIAGSQIPSEPPLMPM